MTLAEMIEKVHEENLTKEQLEDYYKEVSYLHQRLQLELAEKEKMEAIFMHGKDPDESVAARKISWKATQEGLRLIQLKRYSLAAKELLNSLKSRIYAQL